MTTWLALDGSGDGGRSGTSSGGTGGGEGASPPAAGSGGTVVLVVVVVPPGTVVVVVGGAVVGVVAWDTTTLTSGGGAPSGAHTWGAPPAGAGTRVRRSGAVNVTVAGPTPDRSRIVATAWADIATGPPSGVSIRVRARASAYQADDATPDSSEKATPVTLATSAGKGYASHTSPDAGTAGGAGNRRVRASRTVPPSGTSAGSALAPTATVTGAAGHANVTSA